MITTTIDPLRFDNPVNQGLYVLAKLRHSGIPASGVLGVTGVAIGTLTLSAPDLADGSITYTWKEDE